MDGELLSLQEAVELVRVLSNGGFELSDNQPAFGKRAFLGKQKD
jgi:hypothetical protein